MEKEGNINQKKGQKNLVRVEIMRRENKIQTFYSSVFHNPSSLNEDFKYEDGEGSKKNASKSEKVLQAGKKIKFSR